MKERIVSFDALRFILALFVLLGHSWINLYQKIDQVGYHIEALAVDGFFILSGFLLAKSCCSIMQQSNYIPCNAFIKLTSHRFIRLWPEYAFAMFVLLIIKTVNSDHIVWDTIPLNMFFIGQINKIPSIINGTWYVFCLFYVGAILSSIVLYLKQTGVYIFLPLIFLISLLSITSSIGHLVMHGGTFTPPFDYWSTGLLKAFLELSLGMLSFYAINAIKNNVFCFRKNLLIPMFLLFEFIGISFVVVAFCQKNCRTSDYLVLFGYTCIICVLYLRQEKILKFLSLSFIQMIAKYSYMLYLIHVVIIEIVRDKFDYQTYPRFFIYSTILLLSTCFAAFCYHAQKWLFSKLKHFLFVSSSCQYSESLENLRERETSCRVK